MAHQQPPISSQQPPLPPQQPPAPQQAPQPGVAGQFAAQAPSINDAKGFLGALFDMKFENFVTTKFVRFLYWIAVILSVLTWISAIVIGFSMHVVLGIVALFFGWIFAFVSLIFYRMGLEVIYSVVSIASVLKRYAHRDGVKTD